MSVPRKPVQPSLKFASPGEAHNTSRFLMVHTQIRLGKTGLPRTNTQAYLPEVSVTKNKSFIASTLDQFWIKMIVFSSVSNWNISRNGLKNNIKNFCFLIKLSAVFTGYKFGFFFFKTFFSTFKFRFLSKTVWTEQQRRGNQKTSVFYCFRKKHTKLSTFTVKFAAFYCKKWLNTCSNPKCFIKLRSECNI